MAGRAFPLTQLSMQRAPLISSINPNLLAVEITLAYTDIYIYIYYGLLRAQVKTVPTTEKKLGKDGKEKPEVLPTMTCVKQHVSIQCGHLRYEGEVAYLEFDPRNHAGEGDVELTRYPFPEELWKKARDSRSSAQGLQNCKFVPKEFFWAYFLLLFFAARECAWARHEPHAVMHPCTPMQEWNRNF